MDLSILKFSADTEVKDTAAEKARLEKEKREDAKLKQSCRDFESILTGIILKEGLRNAQESSYSSEGDDDRDNSSKQYNEMANEQIAMCIGKQGLLGLGDYLYKSIKAKEANKVTSVNLNKES